MSDRPGPSPGITPKQPQARHRRDWYPYYAGYSVGFAESVLDGHLQEPASLLDPWSGSGTSAVAAAARGIRSLGLDLNPAMAVVALGRLTPVNRAEPVASAIQAATTSRAKRPVADPLDPLRLWFRDRTVSEIRFLIRRAGAGKTLRPDLVRPLSPNSPGFGGQLEESLVWTAMMATVRELLEPFRSSNPSWIKQPQSHRHRIGPSPERVRASFQARAAELIPRLALHSLAAARHARLETRSVLSLASTNAWDACLTSPPYATRIDYVRASLPELATLGLGGQSTDLLRKAMMGTPVVRGRSLRLPTTSPTAGRLLRDIRDHPSHGSTNYYYPWLAAYLYELGTAIALVSAAVRKEGRVAFVVQDSYYKELHIDLQQVTIEFFAAAGRRLCARSDYTPTHLMTHLNSRSRAHMASRHHAESLLVFK